MIINIKVLVFLLLSLSYASAQEMGFGCLGLVGGYIGYCSQQYQPGGINAYILDVNEFNKDSIAVPLSNFNQLKGFRFGLYFFQFTYTGFVVTVKGYYQSLNEKQDVRFFGPGAVTTIHTYEVISKNIGFGMDVGMEITTSFHWKILESWLLFNNFQFNTSVNTVFGITSSETYKDPETNVGYTVGTGFIYYLIDKYVSIESSVGVSKLKTNMLKGNSGKYLQLESGNQKSVDNSIQSGGLTVVLQINFSFPL